MKMYKNRKFDFREFRKVVNGLEKEELDYFVFGGFSLDSINNKLTEHGDLDMIFYEKDRSVIAPFFRRLGYSTYLHGRKEDYRLNLNGSPQKKIDSLFLKDFGDYYELMGNRVRDKISKEAFDHYNRMSINGFDFNIMPYEWFSLYLDCHCDLSKVNEVNETIRKILPLCQPLDILSQEKVEMPINMEKVEL